MSYYDNAVMQAMHLGPFATDRRDTRRGVRQDRFLERSVAKMSATARFYSAR